MSEQITNAPINFGAGPGKLPAEVKNYLIILNMYVFEIIQKVKKNNHMLFIFIFIFIHI
jgi:hypothetical protein